MWARRLGRVAGERWGRHETSSRTSRVSCDMAYTNTRSKNSSRLPTYPLPLSRASAWLPGSELSHPRNHPPTSPAIPTPEPTVLLWWTTRGRAQVQEEMTGRSFGNLRCSAVRPFGWRLPLGRSHIDELARPDLLPRRTTPGSTALSADRSAAPTDRAARLGRITAFLVVAVRSGAGTLDPEHPGLRGSAPRPVLWRCRAHAAGCSPWGSCRASRGAAPRRWPPPRG